MSDITCDEMSFIKERVADMLIESVHAFEHVQEVNRDEAEKMEKTRDNMTRLPGSPARSFNHLTCEERVALKKLGRKQNDYDDTWTENDSEQMKQQRTLEFLCNLDDGYSIDTLHQMQASHFFANWRIRYGGLTYWMVWRDADESDDDE